MMLETILSLKKCDRNENNGPGFPFTKFCRDKVIEG